MNKITQPNGAQVNFEKLVNDIQANAFLNLKNNLSLFLKQAGLSLSVDNGAPGTSFLALWTGGNQIVVSPGKGLTTNYSYIKMDSSIVLKNPLNEVSETAFLVYIKYAVIGSNPVKATNAFVYDIVEAGSLYRNTLFTSSFNVKIKELQNSSISTEPDEIPIAVVYRLGSLFNSEGLESYPYSDNGDYRMVDLRKTFRMLLDENLLSEKSVFFKNRNSIEDQAVTGIVEFKNKVFLTDTLNVGSYELSSLSADLLVKHGEELIASLNPQGGLFSKSFKSEDIQVLKDGVYQQVLTTSLPPSVPRNFRVYNVQPTKDNSAAKALVTFKWNWENLQINSINGSQVVISRDNASFTEDDIESIISTAKNFVFSSGPAFKVLSINTNISEDVWGLELAGSPSPALINDTAKIIDSGIDGYKLLTRVADFSDFVDVDPEAVTTNRESRILDIGVPYNVSLRSLKDGKISNPTQISVTPVLSVSATPGTITLTPNRSGFQVEMSGFSPVNSSSNFNFEVVYSDKIEIISEEVMNDYTTGRLFREITPYKTLQINTPSPSRYWVGVRPLQNQQVIGPAVFKEVVSGGGGVSPQEQILFEDTICVKYIKMTSMGQKTDKSGNVIHEFKNISADNIIEEELSTDLFFGKKIAKVSGAADHLSFNWASLTKVTASDITPALVTNGSDSFITFDINNLETVSPVSQDESSWASVRQTGETAVDSGKTIYFKTTVAIPNWGNTHVSLYLKDAGGEVLDEKKIVKNTLYPRTGSNSYFNIDLDFINKTGETRLVYWEIKVAGFIGNTSAINSLCWIAVNTGEGFSGFTDRGLFIDFGENMFPMSLKTANNSSGSTDHIEPTIVLKDTKTKNIFYSFKNNPQIEKGDLLLLGETKPCRFINEKELNVDFLITAVQFIAGSVTGVDAFNPGIIRIYPKGAESSAAMLEVTGGEGSFYKNINLEVKRSGSQRGFIIDAFDASTNNPNNRCSLEGQVIVYGKPLIKDRD